jgi:hypothetical protein
MPAYCEEESDRKPRLNKLIPELLGRVDKMEYGIHIWQPREDRGDNEDEDLRRRNARCVWLWPRRVGIISRSDAWEKIEGVDIWSRAFYFGQYETEDGEE